MKHELALKDWARLFSTMGYRVTGDRLVRDEDLVDLAKLKVRRVQILEERKADVGL